MVAVISITVKVEHFFICLENGGNVFYYEVKTQVARCQVSKKVSDLIKNVKVKFNLKNIGKREMRWGRRWREGWGGVLFFYILFCFIFLCQNYVGLSKGCAVTNEMVLVSKCTCWVSNVSSESFAQNGVNCIV